MLPWKKEGHLFIILLSIAIFVKNCDIAVAAEKDYLLANFIYNLTDYIKWQNKKITLCSIGYDEVGKTIENLSKTPNQTKFYNIDTLSFKHFISYDEIPECNILYIAQDQEKYVLKILENAKEHRLVTISTLENFCDKGGMLELKVIRRKVKLQISKNLMQELGIELSPVVLISINPETDIDQKIESNNNP